MSEDIFKKIGIREDLLWQMSGYIGFGTNNGRMIAANEGLTQALGYSSISGIYDQHYSNMRCDSSEAAPILIEQDRQSLDTLKPFNSLQVHRYADDELHVIFAKHSPIVLDGKADIVMYSATEFASGPFRDLALTLFKSDDLARQLPGCDSRFYEVGDAKKKTNFTPRELECLFYLIRGKSFNDIGAILGISKRTVETHIDNMKIKNHLNNKPALIEFALEQGLAYFIPESFWGGGP